MCWNVSMNHRVCVPVQRHFGGLGDKPCTDSHFHHTHPDTNPFGSQEYLEDEKGEAQLLAAVYR
jgi:hypothetical protein